MAAVSDSAPAVAQSTAPAPALAVAQTTIVQSDAGLPSLRVTSGDVTVTGSAPTDILNALNLGSDIQQIMESSGAASVPHEAAPSDNAPASPDRDALFAQCREANARMDAASLQLDLRYRALAQAHAYVDIQSLDLSAKLAANEQQAQAVERQLGLLQTAQAEAAASRVAADAILHSGAGAGVNHDTFTAQAMGMQRYASALAQQQSKHDELTAIALRAREQSLVDMSALRSQLDQHRVDEQRAQADAAAKHQALESQAQAHIADIVRYGEDQLAQTKAAHSKEIAELRRQNQELQAMASAHSSQIESSTVLREQLDI